MESRVPVQSSRSMYLCGTQAQEHKGGEVCRESGRMHTQQGLPLWSSQV